MLAIIILFLKLQDGSAFAFYYIKLLKKKNIMINLYFTIGGDFIYILVGLIIGWIIASLKEK